MDESFFFFDSIIRKDSGYPVVRIIGSHQHSSLFGAISLDGRQLFRQYHHFNEDTLYEFLVIIATRNDPIIFMCNSCKKATTFALSVFRRKAEKELLFVIAA